MGIEDPSAVVAALADPETLLVFGVLAARTSKLRVDALGRLEPEPRYVTPFGLMKDTALPREVVDAAAARLKQAGLLEVFPADERGFESWRVSEAALLAAAAGSA